jgi:hypothetical protein
LTDARKEYALVIQPWIKAHVRAGRLSAADGWAVAEIEALESEARGFYMTNANLAARIGVSADRASKLITSLNRRGFISVELVRKGKEKTERRIRINAAARVDISAPLGENAGCTLGENAECPTAKTPTKGLKEELQTKESKEGGDSAARAAKPPTSPEPVKRISSRKQSVAHMVAQGVDEQHAEDWITTRNDKWVLAEDWEKLCDAATEAGITPAEAVHIAAAREWFEFNADWYAEAEKSGLQRGGAQPAAATQAQSDVGDWLGFFSAPAAIAAYSPWGDAYV